MSLFERVLPDLASRVSRDAHCHVSWWHTLICATNGFQSISGTKSAARFVDLREAMNPAVATVSEPSAWWSAASEADLLPRCRTCGCHRVQVVSQPLASALRYVRCTGCDTTAALLTRERK